MNAEEIEEQIRSEVLTETTQETAQETTQETTATTEETKDEFETNFDNFNKHKTEHKIEVAKEPVEKDLFSDENDIAEEDQFKFQMFMGLLFLILDGVHLIIYRIISKYKLDKEDIALDDTDKAGIEMYFRTKRVMALINRLPGEIIGLIHIEYIYFQKFQEFNRQAKLSEGLNPDTEEEEEEEEEIIEKQAPKKAAVKKRKYKKRKKQPVKKAATKTNE